MKNKIKIILVLTSCFVCFQLFPQATKKIDLKNFDYSLTSRLFLEKLNKLRKEQGLGIITDDATLQKAAKDQADYQNKIKKVTHDQTDAKKAKPYLRVLFYNGTHNLVGENCLKDYVFIPAQNPKTKITSTNNTYGDLAESFYQGWKNSPGHYKNMITPYYEAAGLGISIDTASKEVYAAQVFGTLPYIPPKGVTIDNSGYGLLDQEPKSCKFQPEVDFLSVALANYTTISGDSLFVGYASLEYFRKLIEGTNDGMAFDIVTRDQFNCGRNHKLHGHFAFDGVMTKPVYANEIYKNNQYAKQGSMYAFVGKLPYTPKPGTYQVNGIVIKNKHFCRYSYPIDVPNKNFSILTLYPEWTFSTAEIKPDSFDIDLDFIIPFERGKTNVPEKFSHLLSKRLKTYNTYITNAKVQTFSSIEGSEAINIKLQNERAKNIRKEISKITDSSLVTWNIEAKENWDKFYKQIEGTPFGRWKNLDKAKIKEMLNNRSIRDSIDYLLISQRIGKIDLKLKGKFSENMASQIAVIAFYEAIKKGDSLQALAAQTKMIKGLQAYELENQEVSEVTVPMEKKFVPVISNIIAASAFNKDIIFNYESKNFVRKAMKLDQKNFNLQFNICVFAINQMNYYNDTIFGGDTLEEKILSLYNFKRDTASIDQLMLNFYVLTAYNSYKKHKYERLYESLNRVEELYKVAKTSEADALKLGLLFNNYFRFHKTIELLEPWIENTKNTDLVFCYMATRTLLQDDIESLQPVIDKAINQDKKRFCKWINEINFQLLREDIFKTNYCKVCDLK